MSQIITQQRQASMSVSTQCSVSCTGVTFLCLKIASPLQTLKLQFVS